MISAVITLALSPEVTRLVVIALLALFGMGLLAAAGVFGYSIWKQRHYNKMALPTLGVEEKTVEVEGEVTTSAFALELLDEPLPEGAFAKRIDDEGAYAGLDPKEHFGINLEDEVPEDALPLLPETSDPLPATEPVEELLAAEPELEVSPRSTVEDRVYESMELDGEEPDEFPPFTPSGDYEMTPELLAAATPRGPRRLDEDDDEEGLDFTPIALSSEENGLRVQEFRKLRLPTVDKMATPDSSAPLEESAGIEYVGRRRRVAQNDTEAP